MSRFKRMDPDLKQRWLKALRGGGYRQAQGRLRTKRYGDRPHYCCLGVLANVAGESWCDADEIGQHQLIDSTEDEMDLGPELRKKYGLSEAAMNHLVAMNDGGCVEGKNRRVIAEYDATGFKGISDWIEKNL